MSIFKTKINTESTSFAANVAAMKPAVDELNNILATVAEGGGEKACARHTSRGKLLPRERIDRLLDPDTIVGSMDMTFFQYVANTPVVLSDNEIDSVND